MKENKYNTIMFILGTLICIGVGALLQFNTAMQPKTLCSIICGGLVFLGIIEICKFFLTKAYKHINDYSFTVGLAAVILGICGLVRVNSIVPFMLTILIFPCLAIGMLLFQFAVQLNAMHNNIYLAALIESAVVVLGAVLLLLGVIPDSIVESFTNILLMVSGGLGLITYIVVFFNVKAANKPEEPLPLEPLPPMEHEDPKHHEGPKEPEKMEKIIKADL